MEKKELFIPLLFWPQDYSGQVAIPRIALPSKVLAYADYCLENDIPFMLPPVMKDYHENPNSIFRENRKIEITFEKIFKENETENKDGKTK